MSKLETFAWRACFTALILWVPLASSAQVVEPPAKPAVVVPIVSPTMTAVGGQLLTIDAGKATGDVRFDWDTKLFDPKHAEVDGKKLRLAIPKNDDAKTYHVTVISFTDKSVDRVIINVAGDKVKPPVVPPAPADLTVVLARLDKIDKNEATIVASQMAMIARIVALENAKPAPPVVVVLPTPPVDAFQASVQAAFEKDGKPPSVGVLASIYKLSGSVVNDPTLTTLKAIQDKMHAAAQTGLQEPNPAAASVLVNVRQLLAADDIAVLGKTDGPATAAQRALIASQFLKHQKVLEGVVK